MPRKVNIELEYKLKLQSANIKKQAALEAVEVAYKQRLAKIEAWKVAQTTLLEDAKNRPRLSKEEREIQEAKERQKQMLEEGHKKHEERKKAIAEGKTPEPTPREKERASVFDAFASLAEESETEEKQEDMWDTSDMTPENRVRYLRSIIADGNIPPEGYDLPEELRGEKSKKFPPFQKSEKPAEEAKPIVQPLPLSQKSEREEKSETLSPQVPPPSKPKKGIKIARSLVKEIGKGVALYQQPLDE